MRKVTDAGIDVSKDVLDVAVRRDERRFETARFANDAAGHGKLLRWLTKGGRPVLPETMTVRRWVAHAGLDPRAHQSGTSVDKPARISKARVRRTVWPVIALPHRDISKTLRGTLHARHAQRCHRGTLRSVRSPTRALATHKKRRLGDLGRLSCGRFD
jgi:transposase